MVAAVHAAAPDAAFLRRALAALLREHSYWAAPPKAVELAGPGGRRHSLARYWADWRRPRPEAWAHDMALAQGLGANAAAALWHQLASAAESGWDFSSRWMDPGGDGAGLASLATTWLVPADLNALLCQARASPGGGASRCHSHRLPCLAAAQPPPAPPPTFLPQMERNIASFAAELGEAAVAARFEAAAAARAAALDALMWDEGAGRWSDLLLPRGTGGNSEAPPVTGWSRRPGAFASCWVPLFCGCADAGGSRAATAVAGLAASGLVQRGGIAASAVASGQQWDWPNCWPPLQAMLVEGCADYGGARGSALAAAQSAAFLASARGAWEASGRMWEKLDASRERTG